MRNERPPHSDSDGKHHCGQKTGDKNLVSVCFADASINQIFAELLHARGVPTRVVEDLVELSGETRVVTEPMFFPDLPPRYLERTLVVGNCDALDQPPVLTLSRPLTEVKIERALTRFLQT